MALFNLSSNMSLPIPVPEQQTGPAWAGNINSSLTILDSHDHSAGSGVQITASGININTDFPMNINNIISIKSLRFTAQSSFAATTPNLLCVYAIGADLYYNDGNGNQIRITQSGSVSGASGTITGLPSGTASAAYSAGSAKFTWQSASNTGADMDGASVIVREKVASGKGVTITAPVGLAADYAVYLPAALPASQKFMTMDSGGAIASSWAVDNSTLEVSTNTVQIKDLGVSTAKIAALAVTRPKMVAVGQQISSSSGASGGGTSTSYALLTNMTVTITTTGRPVIIMLIDDGSVPTNGSNIALVSNGATTEINARIAIFRDASQLTNSRFQEEVSASSAVYSPPGSISYMDPVAAGTYVYTLKYKMISAGGAFQVSFVKLVAYEL